MALVEWKLDGDAAVLTMTGGENRLNLEFCEAMMEALDRIEMDTGARGLVVTSGHEKIFTNGFDIDWLSPLVEKGDRETASRFLKADHALRRRLLLYPMVTVAAVSGHAFGGGAVLSCCFDFRFMRADRGYFCIPAVDFGFPILPGTAALLKNAMPAPSAREACLTGRRYTAEECESRGIVHRICPMESLLGNALECAKNNAKERSIVKSMKRALYADVIALMETADPPLMDGTAVVV